MATSNLRRYENPEFLRKMGYDRMNAFLMQIQSYLEKQGLRIAGISQSEFNYDLLSNILTNKVFIGEDDECFFNAFALIGATSGEHYNELLKEFILKSEYKDELTDDMSTADMAMLVYAHQPDELNNLAQNELCRKQKSFGMYMTSRNLHEFEITETFREQFEHAMNQCLESKHYGQTADLKNWYEENGDIVFIVRRGDSYKRQGAVVSGKQSKTVGYQGESFNKLILNRESGELRVCCSTSPKWLESAYFQSLGMSLFRDPGAFTPLINNLEQIKELKESITLYRSDGITEIDLLETFGYETPASSQLTRHTSTRGNLFMDFAKDGNDIESMGKFMELIFRVYRGKASRRVRVTASNRSSFEDDEFGSAIYKWLRIEGIIQPLEHKNEHVA